MQRFGSKKLTMEQILAPAIELAEKGFPVAPIASFFWKRGEVNNTDDNDLFVFVFTM